MTAWRAEQSDEKLAAIRDAHRETARQLRLDQIRSWVEAQNGCCYLCGDELGDVSSHEVHMDHDHRCCGKYKRRLGLGGCSACRRGLACKSCNLLVGYARDNPDRLRRIADNLEKAMALVTERMEG